MSVARGFSWGEVFVEDMERRGQVIGTVSEPFLFVHGAWPYVLGLEYTQKVAELWVG